MQAYLAEKYMSGPKADAILARSSTGKKKKRKAGTGADPSSSSSGAAGPSFIKDDDISGFSQLRGDEDDDSAAPLVASDRGFKKRRTAPTAGSAGADAGWTTVREGATAAREETPPPADDEQPLVVDAAGGGAAAPAAPFTGGLLTKAQIASTLPSAKKAEKKMTKEEEAAAQETVYRDASGRKIDMKAEKAEAARKKREREEKEARKMEWGKGVVQRDEAEEARKRLERMKTTGFARTVDDKELNEDQKGVERWNDPAAQFLTVSLERKFVFSEHGLTISVEKEDERASKTRIHRPSASTKSIRHQAWLSVGWRRCVLLCLFHVFKRLDPFLRPEHRVRAEALPADERAKTNRGRELCMGHGRHVTERVYFFAVCVHYIEGHTDLRAMTACLNYCIRSRTSAEWRRSACKVSICFDNRGHRLTL
jgi:pre-mRNA-splicing factor CWC26